MKKLFLYMTYFLAVFLISFAIAFGIYKDYTPNYKGYVPSDYSVISVDLYNKINKYYASVKTDVPTNHRYILNVIGDSIVVCIDSIDEIYEYTGININKVKREDNETYQKIMEHIEFESKDKLMDFLESISS